MRRHGVEASFHRVTALLSLMKARERPSGLKAMLKTELGRTSERRREESAAMFQTVSAWPSPDTRDCPSGLNAALK
jgi:hypothetical protein